LYFVQEKFIRILKLLPSFLLTVGLYAQAPVITSIQNPASNILPGLPNFGIAQGQIFVLYGSNMGPATLAQPTALPWPTSFSGTTIGITQGSNTFNAPIIYTSAGQIAAVMPSTVAVGSANILVAYNSISSKAFATTIVANNFGMSSVDQTGTGPAVITTATYALITSANSAIPGNTYTMWGTGLGAAISGNTDNNVNVFAAVGPAPQVLVGGISATVTYAGRSPGAGPGLDQINFTIPAGLSGCFVSVQVVTPTTPVIVSNATTIPIAATGGGCSDVNGLSASIANTALSTKGSFAVGGANVSGGQPASGNTGQAQAIFGRFTAAQWALFDTPANLGTVSLGSCVTQVSAGGNGGSGGPSGFTGLDAGTTVTLTPPGAAALSLTLAKAGSYGANISSVPPGSYALTDGAGGKDIGAFSVTFAGPPALIWTNQSTTSIVRSQGFKVTWTGGDVNSYVDIVGQSQATSSGPGNANGASFDCQAPAASGSFTIPASVLLALPANSGQVFVTANENTQTLTIPGADEGFAFMSGVSATASVTFK